MRMSWVAPEVARDQAPAVQRRRPLRGEPVRDRVVAEQVAVPVVGDHDQLADAGQGADDQHPDHHHSGGDTAVRAGAVMAHGCLRFCGLQVFAGLGLKALGDRIGHRLARGLAGQFDGEGGDAQPGDAERPGAEHVREVMHAEQQPADADRDDQRDDHRGEHAAPNPAGRGKEDKEQRAVADDRAERVPAGEAVAVAVRDRVRHHRAQPADQGLEHRVEHELAGARDQQEDREPPAPPDGEQDDGGTRHRPQHAAAAQPGDRLDDADQCGIAGDEAVQPRCRVVIGGLKRRELQPYKKQQNSENERRNGDGCNGRKGASGSGCCGHGLPASLCEPFHARLRPRSLSAFLSEWRGRCRKCLTAR